MGSFIALILFVVGAVILIKMYKKKEEEEENKPVEDFDDSNVPDFKPFLDSRIGGPEENEEEETPSYNDFLEY
jgi:hypothetical protein